MRRGEEGGEGAAEETGKQETDWRAKARSWERTAKKAQKERADYEKKLKDREEIDKSTHEKAVEAARQDGEKTAREAAREGAPRRPAGDGRDPARVQGLQDQGRRRQGDDAPLRRS